MALVQVILAGLSMLSEIGLRTSVMRDPRGEEEVFLNTVWTMQICRGIVLWLIVWALSSTFAQFYEQPLLEQILPVAALSLVVQGFYTTNVLSVQRNLQLGRFSFLKLCAQAGQLIVIVVLAAVMDSVWALVIGLVVHPLIALILFRTFLPGIRNRLGFERDSAKAIFGLGKFLFFSTIATFVINQSDRAFLGKAIEIDMLGVYGIGFALAVLPTTLATTIANSVVFPLYRMRHPLDSADNQAKIFKARRSVAAVALGVTCVMAFVGPALVSFVYDDRYVLAGPMAVALCIANIPNIVLIGAMNAALSKGDSYRYMLMIVTTSLIQITLMSTLVWSLGVLGAALSIGLAPLLSYPLLARFLTRYASWDAKGDLGLMAGAFAITGIALWLHWDAVFALVS